MKVEKLNSKYDGGIGNSVDRISNNYYSLESKPTFSNEELSMLGTLHNLYAKDAVAIIKRNNMVVSRESLVAVFLDLYTPPLISTFSSSAWTNILHMSISAALESISNPAEKVNRNYLAAPLISENSPIIAFRDLIFRCIDQGLGLSDFYRAMDNIGIQAERELFGQNLEIVLGTVNIAKSSAYLWFSKSDGGMGLLDSIKSGGNFPTMPYTHGSLTAGKWNTGNAVRGDVGSSFAYFAGLGFLGLISAAVPGTNVAILGGWAVAVAVGSAASGFGIF